MISVLIYCCTREWLWHALLKKRKKENLLTDLCRLILLFFNWGCSNYFPTSHIPNCHDLPVKCNYSLEYFLKDLLWLLTDVTWYQSYRYLHYIRVELVVSLYVALQQLKLAKFYMPDLWRLSQIEWIWDLPLINRSSNVHLNKSANLCRHCQGYSCVLHVPAVQEFFILFYYQIYARKMDTN